jgi:RND family efflux transporter MFP subunit
MLGDGSTYAATPGLVPGRLRSFRPRLGRRASIFGGIGFAVLVAAGIAARVVLAPAKAPPEAPATVATVSVVPVAKAMLADSLLVNGSLTPWEDLSIGAEASGLAITRVLVEEGDRVKAGKLLAKLDDALLQAQLKQTEAQIARSRATLKINEADVQRARELLKTSAISVQAAEQRQATADAARADLALAEAQRAALQAQFDQTEIRAPADGLISQRTARLGKVVTPGDPLFREVRDGILELDAEVPDRLLPRIHPGQTVLVRQADGSEETGTVRLVAPLVDKVSRNGIAHVRFPPNDRLKAGTFVTGQLVLDRAETLAVPEAAVLVKDGHALVYVVGEGDKATARAVETGQRTEGKVAIRSGLAEGERVAILGAGFLHDGDRVTVAEAPGAVR